MTDISRLRLFVCITVATTLFACQDARQQDDGRSAEQTATYLALNDSMLHLKPTALNDIRRQMAAAAEADDSLTWYDYYLMYGRHFLLSDTPDSILPYIDRTLQYVGGMEQMTPRIRGLAAKANSSKASYHYMLYHNADSVIALYQRAYDLMLQSDMEDNLPDLCANMGDAYIQKNDLPQASRWYRRAILLVDSLGLPADRNITLYMGLGRIYTTLRDFDQAREFYAMADKKFDLMKPNMQSYFLNNYGNYFYYKREYKEALRMFQRLKKHLEQYDATEYFDMYLCKINMADVYLNLGQLDSARYYVEPAEAFFQQQNISTALYYAHTIRIGIALKEGRFVDVNRIIAEEHGLSISDPNIKGIRDRYLNQYYAAIGDFRTAFEGLSADRQQADSAETHMISMRSSDIMTRLTEDTIRLHHQLQMNEREAQYTKQRTAFWMILGILVIIILALVAWFSYEHRRMLQQQLDILTLRMNNARQRISPHFVFNVLNSRMNDTGQEEKDQLLMLAKLIRTNLDMTTQNYVTLAEELDFVNQYIEVERVLLGEDFSYTLEAPERNILEAVTMPSMLIQIIVENAILHGLKQLEHDKKLTITIESNQQDTTIEVADNGPGFDVSHISSERLRTGMNIIRNTLAAINQQNRQHPMTFRIHNDHGCHAVLTIPKGLKIDKLKN